MSKKGFSTGWRVAAALGILMVLPGCRSKDGELNLFTAGSTPDGRVTWLGVAENFPESQIEAAATWENGCVGKTLGFEGYDASFTGFICVNKK